MYAKNLPSPPKFNFPYQQQQRYSGSFVQAEKPERQETLSTETLQKIAASLGNLEAAEK